MTSIKSNGINYHFTDAMSHEDRAKYMLGSLDFLAGKFAERLAIADPAFVTGVRDGTITHDSEPTTDEGKFLYIALNFVYNTISSIGVSLEYDYANDEDEVTDEGNSD